MQLVELKKHGISPDKDCRQILFADGLQEPVDFAVKEGRADVGTVRTGIMERLAEKGEINLADFIIFKLSFGRHGLVENEERFSIIG